MVTKDINEIIRSLLEEKGLSKREVSELIDVSLGAVCNAINHEDTKLDKVRVKLLRALGVECKIVKEIILV